MLNYTESIASLMRDIAARVEELSTVDLSSVLVFARFGRTGADGPYATCHSLNLPTSEPGYFFWRDRLTGEITRRSEWFVTKSPSVVLGGTRIDYLLSFVLPRFCDQTLAQTQKAQRYPGAEPWMAKLDTIVHELYHIDPGEAGIRRITRGDGETSHRSHSPEFFEDVTRFVTRYLATAPDPELLEFLRYDFAGLRARYGDIVGTTFRRFPSYPQRYHEALCSQPEAPAAPIVPLRRAARQHRFDDADLALRSFTAHGTRRLPASPGAH